MKLWKLKPSWAIILVDTEKDLKTVMRSLNKKQPKTQQTACGKSLKDTLQKQLGCKQQESKPKRTFLRNTTGTKAPYQSSGKASPVAQLWSIHLQCMRCAGDMGSILGLGRSLGEGNDGPLQYSCLVHLMDRGSLAGYRPRGWNSWIRLSNLTAMKGSVKRNWRL